MGKLIQTKILYAFGLALLAASFLGIAIPIDASAFDENAKPIMLNRTAISMGNPANAANIFYDKDTSNDDEVWQNTTNGCYSDISRESTPANSETGTGGAKWVLRSSTKMSNGDCSPEKTTDIPAPTNFTERRYTVFYRSSDDVVHSVKADLELDFINTSLGARGNVNAIYIQKGVDPFSCPSLIVDQKSPDGWAYVMMERSDKAENASNQYDSLIKALGTSGFFGSTDVSTFNDVCKVAGDEDDEGNLKKIGLPESYFNAGNSKSNYEDVDFGYSGSRLGAVDIHTMYGPDAAGMALSGPLRGGFIASGELDGGTDGGSSNEPVCSAGALGWVICPMMSVMADVIGWVAGVLEGYLAFNPFAGDNNSIKQIWSNILNVANVILVIAFLVVVFSQSTSLGISNYGIKRMLPRIIAAAILMNISYYICQILVDISNILGVGVSSLVSATTGNSFSQNVTDVSDLSKAVASVGIIAIVIFFFLIPVALSFLAVMFTIAARNAIIVLLVIVAPLAFAAWILPNTEKYFKKWWELLVNMLLLFPMVMLMFSASIVAANAISSVDPGNGTLDAGEELQGIIALLVLALPLFALPFLFKTAGSALGKINALTRKGLNDYGGKQANKYIGGKARQYGKFGAFAAGAGAAKGINKASGGKMFDPNKPGRLTRGYRNVRAFDKAVGTSLDVRKQGKQAEIQENAARLAGRRVVGSTLAGVGGTRYQEIAASQIDKAFTERKSALRASFDQRPPAASLTAELTGYEKEFADAIEGEDAAKAGAIVDYLSSARGATGRATLETMLTKYSKNVTHGSEVHRALNNALNRDNYTTLVSKRGAVAKGGFDYETVKDAAGNDVKDEKGNAVLARDSGGNYIIKGYKLNLGGVGTEQLATQDAKSLVSNFKDIKVEEAKRVLENEELLSKISDADAFELLEWRSKGNVDVPARFKETHPDPSPGDDEGLI